MVNGYGNMRFETQNSDLRKNYLTNLIYVRCLGVLRMYGSPPPNTLGTLTY